MKKLIVLVLIGLLFGCSKNKSSENPESSVLSADSTPTGPNSDIASKLIAAEIKAHGPKIGPDMSVPRENYTKLDQDNNTDWLTYLAVGHANKKIDDSELLNLFSAKYNNEADVFKKQELIPSELPPIKQLLGAYSKQRYYSLEFGRSHAAFNLTLDLTGGYDFQDKSFSVETGHDCLGRYMNQQVGSLWFRDVSSALCNPKVDDLEKAKLIEQLRASKSIYIRGTIYFFVRGVEDHTVDAVPTYLLYEFYDKPHFAKDGKQIFSVLMKALPTVQR